MMEFINNLRYFFKNLWDYKEVLWNDRDYDYEYFYRVIQFKLNKIDRNLSYKRNRYIPICVKLIDIILSDYYFDEASKLHKSKWGEVIISLTEPCNTDITDVNIRKALFSYKEATTSELYEQAELEFKELFKVANKKHNKAKNLLFKILNEESLRWWE